MLQPYTSYPVKIVSRSAAQGRMRRLRFTWLVAGIAFGIGCSSALTPMFGTPSEQLAEAIEQNEPTIDTAANDAALAAAPAVEETTDELAQTESDASESSFSFNFWPFNRSKDAELAEAGEDDANEFAHIDSQALAAIVGAAPQLTPEEAAADASENAVQRAQLASATSYPVTLNLKVERGDSFTTLLTDAGVPTDEAKSVAESIKSIFNPRRLTAGTQVSLQIDKTAQGERIIRSMSLPMSKISKIEVSRAADDSFNVKRIDEPTVKKLAHVGGRINNSLYQTGIEAGLPPSMINEIINAYSYDIDFQREIKKGNNMSVLFERMETKDGVVAGNGNLVYAELELADRRLKIYRYTGKDGSSDFYNEKGESIRKALLRTPINGARISSGFGMRNHPIMGYSKMHKGVDFAAPIGTPIYAAGDGIVEMAAVKGGYGNYLKIKHNDRYSSAYAHLSRFASGVTPGKRVKQGQIVAYVGNTGASTGPHLHYEILQAGTQINPANVKFKTGNVLTGKELLAFKSTIQKVDAKLASIQQGTTVAMVEGELETKAN
jgi:murein DD-endopeptidase MepM/ murein hydrolase activator NlpD